MVKDYFRKRALLGLHGGDAEDFSRFSFPMSFDT